MKSRERLIYDNLIIGLTFWGQHVKCQGQGLITWTFVFSEYWHRTNWYAGYLKWKYEGEREDPTWVGDQEIQCQIHSDVQH